MHCFHRNISTAADMFMLPMTSCQWSVTEGKTPHSISGWQAQSVNSTFSLEACARWNKRVTDPGSLRVWLTSLLSAPETLCHMRWQGDASVTKRRLSIPSNGRFRNNLDAKLSPVTATQGDSSATEGKTVHYIQWKVQHQSGLQAQTVNITSPLVQAACDHS